MNAAMEHCDKQIAECEQLRSLYPQETAVLNRLINGWQRTKQQLQVRAPKQATQRSK
ncbi:hypothetical protein ACROAG_01615 [Shewanella oncorhynchi]|uniref:hypothetical protein n=1 Tax=Shewanella oncorhynchi TaxID=2726434 RepID=UPI003D7AEC53